MKTRIPAVPAAKVIVAALAITLLVSLPAQRLAPGLTFLELGALLFAALMAFCGLVIASLMLAQWVLRQGGTDPQWFWFGGEPPGLEQLREEARAAKGG